MTSSDNPGTSVYKLYTAIIEKKPDGQVLSISSPQAPEFKKLLEDCTDSNNQLAHASCEALVALVSQGCAEFKFILDCLLNVTPTGRNLGPVVIAVFNLLVIQMKLLLTESARNFKSPYEIRHNPHPFVTILTNRPELWPHILQLFKQCPAHKDDRVRSNFLELLGPFLKFVLIDPTKRHHQLKADLESFLIESLRETDQNGEEFQKVLEFLVDIVPMMQVNRLEDLGHMTAFLQKILQSLMSRHSAVHNTMSLFAERLLSLCHHMLGNGLEIGPTLDLLNRIASVAPNALQEESVLVMATELLLICPDHNLVTLIQFVERLLGIVHPSPLMAGVVMLPLLHIIANPSQSLQPKRKQMIKKVAVSCLQTVEEIAGNKEKELSASEKETSSASRMEYCTHQHFANMVSSFQASERLAYDWLMSIQSSLGSVKVITQNIVNLVASLFLNTKDNDNQMELTADVLVKIAKIDTAKASTLLPIFLYKLKRTKNAAERFSLLYRIPQLATHRSAVGAILRFIQMLGTSPDLHPVSIRLLTELWKNQDRCYPYLLKVLLDDDDATAVSADRCETLVAKAAAIRDVCKLKPHQHGSELLALISKILNECVTDEEVLASALALEALRLLCEAEVIEVKTAWKVMADQLMQDRRPLVAVKICELFSVVPKLRQTAPDYEDFVHETAAYLWFLSQSEEEMIQIAAYKALAAFRLDDFKFDHIPDKVKADIKLPEPEVEGEEPTLSYIPAFCFTRLLTGLTPSVVPAFREFLTSLVRQEVKNLPRGIHHSAMRRQNTVTPVGKAINSIPGLLQIKYEQVKNPGLRPSLAAGLLFCYDPPVEVGRDGRTRKHYIVQHGRNYEQFLKSLLHEVPLQMTDWHRCIHLPDAWVAFMERMFTSCLAARNAELEIQLRQEKLTEEEAKVKKETAWLWLRDRLTDTLKTASRGHVNQQANSLFALTGLTLATHKYSTGMDNNTERDQEEASQHIGMNHWTLMVVETTVSILDQSFHATTQILPWGNTGHAASSINQASVLLRCSAALSLPLLVPVMITSDAERLKHIIDILERHLPGKQHIDDVPPALQFHAGLGLGMFIAALQREHFSEVGGTQGMVTLWKTIELLEHTSLDASSDYHSGAVLGLGSVLVSLCSDSRLDSQVHAMTTLDRMLTLLDQLNPEDKIFESLCRSIAVVTEAAYSANAISGDIAQHVAEKLFQLHQMHKQVCGLSMALGLLCHGMQRVGHAMAEGIQKGLFTTWMECLASKNTTIAEKLTSISGLISLVGSERSLAAPGGIASNSPVNIVDLVRSLSECLSMKNDSDLSVQEHTAWLLGHFYQSACSIVETRASVPVSYTYLPEESVLRALVDSLQVLIKSGPECCSSEHHCAILGALADGPKHVLPPCNWPGLLAPILRMSFGVATKCLALKIAVEQSKRVSTVAMFLASWITSPLFENLDGTCQLLLYEALGSLAKTAPADKLEQFLQNGCMAPFEGGAADENGQSAVLKGLKAALMIPNPPQSVMGHLYNCLESVFQVIRQHHKPNILTMFCECLSEVPDEVVDRTLQLDLSSDDAFMRGVHIRCWLVGRGKQPIALLNPCIDAALRRKTSDYETLGWLFVKSFYAMSNCDGEYAAAMNRLQWLLELMGHVRNSVQTSELDKDFSKMLLFSICIVTSAFITWSTRTPALILALSHETSYSMEKSSLPKVVVQEIQTVAPGAVQVMMEKEPWKQINNKILDWLLTMVHISNQVGSDETELLKGLVLATRHTEEAKKMNFWTRMVLL